MNKIGNTMQSYIQSKNQELEILKQKLSGLNPNNILKLGYAKVESNGFPVNAKIDAKPNQDIDVYFADGKIKAVVKEVD